MSQDRIHRDLRENLQRKIKRAVQDHVELCEVAEIRSSDVAAGIADTMLQMVASYFLLLDMTPQRYAQLCYDTYKELQEDRPQQPQQQRKS